MIYKQLRAKRLKREHQEKKMVTKQLRQQKKMLQDKIMQSVLRSEKGGY